MLVAGADAGAARPPQLQTSAALAADAPAAGAGGAPLLPETNALRALSRVQSKLEGYDYTDLTGTPLTVESHVRRAVAEATDTSKLAVQFAGWQAWL
jgi:hypothetical protein